MTQRQLTQIANKLGYPKGLTHLNGGCWGYKGNSTWTLVLSTNKDGLLCGIETNTNYWKPTPDVLRINSVASFSNPLGYDQIIELLSVSPS